MTEEKKAALAGETAADEQKLQKERKTIDALTDFSNMYDFKKDSNHEYKTEAGLTPDVVREISAKKDEPQWMLDARLKSLDLLFTRPDGTLPQTQEEAELFQAHAYRLAVKCYQPQIPFDIQLKEPLLEQYSRLSYDPAPFYRKNAVPFYLSQPFGMPKEMTYRESRRRTAPLPASPSTQSWTTP